MKTLAMAIAAVSIFGVLQTHAQQTVTGNSQMGIYGENGNNTTGTNYGSTAHGSYNASDPSYAYGQATANGDGSGSAWTGANSVSSQAQGMSNSSVTGGGNNVSLGVSGQTGQGNWIGLNDGPTSNNWANAGNSTSANYDGTVTGQSPFILSGNAGADGHSKVTSNVGALSASSTTKTIGESSASVSMGNVPKCFSINIDPTVKGTGSADAQSFVGNTAGTFAGASHNGNASYSVSDTQSASGELRIAGQNSATMGSNSVAANSTISSIASAH
jgi:hypothetical protein